jgi:muramoyltetrapeptide carboxypeptidase LdcA involved in peptidoglycan recycling
VDRMLTQLDQACGNRLFELLSGLAVGDFGSALAPDAPEGTVDVLKWYWLVQLNIPATLPVIIEFPLGHIHDARVVALGAVGKLDLSGEKLITDDVHVA